MEFLYSNCSTYRSGAISLSKYYEDYIFEESTYKRGTSSCETDIYMYKTIEDDYTFVTTLCKNDEKDSLKDYEEYYKTLIDTISIKKYNIKEIDSKYLKLYEEGGESNGGDHLYLNSNKVKIDDKLKLDFLNYNVANINEGINILLKNKKLHSNITF